MKICSTPKSGLRPDFYIARVGSHAGKPMLEPYTANNSFAVYSDKPEDDYQKVMMAYRTKMFDNFVYGSCQPFIRLRDVRGVVDSIGEIDQKHLDAAKAVEAHIATLELQLSKAKELQRAFQQAAIVKAVKR